MSGTNKYKGKYVKIDPNDPDALGVCDESGFVFNHKDLCKQMEWRGDNLVWTGMMRGRPYLDVPSEQNRPAIGKADPKPMKNPKLPTPYTDPDANQVLPPKQLLDKLNKVHWN